METLKAATEAELGKMVRGLSDKGGTVEIISGGTKRALGRSASSSATLDMSGFTGILSYEPDELVLSVRAGTSIAEINDALSKRNQILGFSSADWGPLFGAAANRATAAGTICADASGARRVKAGGARDHLIGCKFVNGSGELVTAGGRVVKNVTGFDITKLMCGAFGTLGALTELTFRVVPAPKRSRTLVVVCTPAEGFTLLRKIARLPLDPTGLSYVPAALGASLPVNAVQGQGAAFIRVEGEDAGIAEKIAVLKTECAGFEHSLLDDDETRALFDAIGNVTPFCGRKDELWRLCVPATEAHEALVQSQARLWYADCSGSVLWLALDATREVAARLRAITAKSTGHATLVRAAAPARADLDVFEPQTQAHAGLTRALKAAFDPARILNRSRMYDEV